MNPVRPLALVLSAALALGACASDGSGTTTEVLGTDEMAGFPVTIENCGIEHSFDAPPERAVTMNQHVTELLLALGLEDRMVGTAYLDSPVHDDLVAAYAQVPVLADEYPTREQVLAAEPDIVIGGFASAFGDSAAGSRQALAEADVASFLTSGYCPDLDRAQSLDLVLDDIVDLGAVFGVPDAATDLVAAVEGAVGETAAKLRGVDPVDVFVYDSGTDHAFTAAGFESTTALIELAGGRNIFSDVEESFTEVSWEEVVDRDPDVVLILDYGPESVGDKRELLHSHPVASTLRAVAEERFAVADLTDVVPGVRNGDAVRNLAAALHPDRA
jgi:iron complex transport system substrate-binding protein